MGVHGTPEYAKRKKKGFKPKTWKKSKSQQMKDYWKERKKGEDKANQNLIKLTDYRPMDAQARAHRALDLGKKVVMMVTGARYGKTFAGGQEVRRQQEKAPRPGKVRANLSWVVAPTYTHLQVVVRMMEKLYRGAYLKYTASPYPKWIFPNPHGPMPYIVEGRSADNPQSLVGAELDFCWYDEAARGNQESVDIIRTRMLTTGGQLLMTTTPFYMAPWFRNNFTDLADPKHPDHNSSYYIVRARTSDNVLNTDRDIKILTRGWSKEQIEQEIEGKDVSFTGAVYRRFDISKNVIDIGDDPKKFLQEDDEIIGGVDWGWDDPFVFLFIVKRGNTYYIIDEYYKQHEQLEEHAKYLVGNALTRRVGRAYADPSRPDSRAKLRDLLGFPINRGRTERTDLHAGIDFVTSLIDNNRLYVSSRCEQTIKEFGMYSWVKKEDKNSKDVPQDAWNHCMDALRYVCYSTRNNGGELHVPTQNDKVMVTQAFAKKKDRVFRIVPRRKKEKLRFGKKPKVSTRNSWMGDKR